MEICKEAQECIKKGNITVSDDIEFRTIRDITDLFHKHYEGYQRSWIKIGEDWTIVASCFQMPDNRIYENMLSADGKCFCYSMKDGNIIEKKKKVNGIIDHPMRTTYLFLKYPNSKGYKFVGIFEKDIKAMEKSLITDKPMVIYKKVADKLVIKK